MVIFRRIEISLLAAILVVAAFLRLLYLDAIPEGWHHDEALMGIMATEVYKGVQRPIFFTGYLGQEPLYIYLAAIAMWLMGGNTDILPLRLTSAAIGIATVIVTYLLGRELFGRRVGVISAALFAFSFWQVMLDRDGYRLVNQPLLQGLAAFLLWRGVSQRSPLFSIAAGAALGGIIYTYLGARAFPGVLIAFGLWWLVARGWPSKQTCWHVALALIVAALVAAPLLLFFATHPGTFSARIDQVSVLRLAEMSTAYASPIEYFWILAKALGQNIAKLLATFTVYGDPLWRYNISGRPIFVGPIALAFYIGLSALVIKAVRRHSPSALALSWLIVMAFPSFLSYDVGAYTFRSIGLVPMLYLVPGIGLTTLWDFIETRATALWLRSARQLQQSVILRVALTVSVVLLLISEALTTYHDYFDVWANSFAAAYEDMADVVAAARFLQRAARPGSENIFISSDYYPHPIFAHLAPAAYNAARWFDGNTVIVIPGGSPRDSLYVFPLSALPKHLDSYLPPTAIVAKSNFSNGAIKFIAYRLMPVQAAATTDKLLADLSLNKVDITLGDDIRLLAYRLDERSVQGDKLAVTAIWQTLRDAPPRDYVFFVHLLDNEGRMWAQYDTPGYPAPEWRAGDIVIGQYELAIDEHVPPGRYAIDIGVYDRPTLERLPVRGASAPADSLRLGFAKVASTQYQSTTPSVIVNRSLGEAIVLQGFDLERLGQSPNPPSLHLKLHWQAIGVPEDDYTVFVQLLNSAGQLVAQSDAQPARGRFPTSAWEPGDTISDEHDLRLPIGLPPGRYKLIAGMYLLASGERLPVVGGGDYIVLADLDL